MAKKRKAAAPAPPSKKRSRRLAVRQDVGRSNRRPEQGSKQKPDLRPRSHLRIYGLHAARAALENPARHVVRVLLTKRAEEKLDDALVQRAEIARKSGQDCAFAPCTMQEIGSTLEDGAVHQGVALEVAPLEAPEPETFFENLRENDTSLVVVLDQVTDPHNVGAIIRSAAVFGADAIVMTMRNSPPLESVLAKAASGGLELVPILKVTNLARALDEMKQAGFFCAGLDGDAKRDLDDAVTASHVALVMGAEETGLRRLTRERCDVLAKIPAFGAIRSLNVSNAAAVAMSAVRRCMPTVKRGA